jgi:hypothetical protein
MNKKLIAINLLLLVTAVLLGWQLRNSILRFKAENNISKIQPVRDIKQKAVAEPGLVSAAPPAPYDPNAFSVIPDKNVFAESRTKEDVVAQPAVPEVPPLAQKPILVGVTSMGERSQAIIIDPTSAQPTRRAQTKHIGDVYQGYTITAITPDQMILESGSRREIIPLHEGTKRTGQGGKTAILGTRVVSFGGTIASTTGPAPTVAGGARSSAPPVPTSTSIGGSSAAAPNQAATRQPAQPARGAQPAVGQPSSATGQPAANQTRRVIRTPFGDVVQNPTE